MSSTMAQLPRWFRMATIHRPRRLLKLLAAMFLVWVVIGWITDEPEEEMSNRAPQSHTPETAQRRGVGQVVNASRLVNDVVIYNRVPKCASTSVRLVLHRASAGNNVTVHVSKIHTQEYLNSTGQVTLVKKLMTMTKPLVFIRHLFFVDFTQLGHPQPIYINMIRDPLERLVSDYYFKRYNLRHMFPMSDKQRDRSYNECVQWNYTECIGASPKGYFRIIPYFCGMDRRCLVPSTWALNEAKRHVHRYFLVVATVQHVTKFLETLERLLPQYFSGVVNSYFLGGPKLRTMAKTSRKDQLEEKTVSIMKQKLAYDYDFYRFIEQRFQKLYNIVFQENWERS